VLALGIGAGGAATPSLPTLLARHVPIVVLHPAERLAPVPVAGFLADSDLMRPAAGGGWEKMDGPLPSGGTNFRLDQRLCLAVQGVAAIPCYASSQGAHNSAPTIYGFASRSGGRIVLQYWFFYVFNGYSPTVPAGAIWQVHEGDWEAVSVVLDAKGKPLLAGYSRHCSGARRAWAKVAKEGARPVVYVGLGSHANYFAPGEKALEKRCGGQIVVDIVEANKVKLVDHAARGRAVRPRLVRVTATTPSWMAFGGTWGEDGYVHFPNVEPPFRNNAGPRGPAFHAQWQKPLSTVLGWPAG
jgi:hypothetical protein